MEPTTFKEKFASIEMWHTALRTCKAGSVGLLILLGDFV